MSSSEEPPLNPENNPPPIIHDSNPFSTPKSLDYAAQPVYDGRAVPLGVGYWLMILGSFLVTAYFAVGYPGFSIFCGWIFLFAGLRVPLRDLRRRSLGYPPTTSRMLAGAGDYILSLLLSAGLTLAMFTVFFTVCTASAFGLSSIGGDETWIMAAFGLGGLAALGSFILLFIVSLRV